MKKSIPIQFLTSFFLLFKASIEKYEIKDEKIFGIVGWVDEDDKQDFSWTYNNEDELLLITKSLSDYLNDNKLVEGDFIKISEKELLYRLTHSGWVEDDVKKGIDYLCSVDVKMLDDGEETDSFFIHF